MTLVWMKTCLVLSLDEVGRFVLFCCHLIHDVSSTCIIQTGIQLDLSLVTPKNCSFDDCCIIL